jgi:putative ABC transport system permease protein
MAFIDAELFRVAFKNLKGRQLRSFLTILGIVIGIAAIVALISIGEGLNQSVSEQFESLGTDTLMVLPGGGLMESVFAKLSDDDVDTIEQVKGVDFAAAIYVATPQADFRGEKQSVMAIGIDIGKIDKLGFIGIAKVKEGRILAKNDTAAVVLGSNFASKVMKEEIGLRQTIELGGKKFRVAGILEEAKNSFGTMFNTAIMMGSDQLKGISETELTPLRIIVKGLPGENIDDLKQRISDRLEREHNKKDFQVMGMQQVSDIAGSVVGMISLVLIGIAGISLLVGGIGIMNTMLMSVMERTQEVGVMKAIGATTPRITSIFVVEAGMIGLGGGIIGLFIGAGAAVLISAIAAASGLPLEAVVSPALIAGALLFSVTVGMAAGVYPAIRAASIDPVEALRYE